MMPRRAVLAIYRGTKATRARALLDTRWALSTSSAYAVFQNSRSTARVPADAVEPKSVAKVVNSRRS